MVQDVLKQTQVYGIVHVGKKGFLVIFALIVDQRNHLKNLKHGIASVERRESPIISVLTVERREESSL